MKLSVIDDSNFEIFLINDFDVDYENKESLIKFLKDYIIKVKKKYKRILVGFYEVNICLINNIGIRMVFKKIDDYAFSDKIIDLKIVIELNPNIYLKFDDYDVIEKYEKVKYENSNYYINISQVEEKDVLFLSEFYEIIYDCDYLENLKYLKS